MLNQLLKLEIKNSTTCLRLLFFLFFTAFSIRASCNDLFQQDCLCLETRSVIEAKAGYFFFSNSKMRKVYDSGGWDVQLSSSYPLWHPIQRLSLNAYGSVEYLHCSGRSIGENQKTSLWEIPVNIGLKPVILICPEIQYYLALGPRYFYIHQDNHSSYVDRNKSRNGVGLFANTGFNLILGRRFFIDIFGEYSYAKTHFHSKKSNVYTRNIQVGGFTFGGGVGYDF